MVHTASSNDYTEITKETVKELTRIRMHLWMRWQADDSSLSILGQQAKKKKRKRKNIDVNDSNRFIMKGFSIDGGR